MILLTQYFEIHFPEQDSLKQLDHHHRLQCIPYPLHESKEEVRLSREHSQCISPSEWVVHLSFLTLPMEPQQEAL